MPTAGPDQRIPSFLSAVPTLITFPQPTRLPVRCTAYSHRKLEVGVPSQAQVLPGAESKVAFLCSSAETGQENSLVLCVLRCVPEHGWLF